MNNERINRIASKIIAKPINAAEDNRMNTFRELTKQGDALSGYFKIGNVEASVTFDRGQGLVLNLPKFGNMPQRTTVNTKYATDAVKEMKNWITVTEKAIQHYDSKKKQADEIFKEMKELDKR